MTRLLFLSTIISMLMSMNAYGTDLISIDTLPKEERFIANDGASIYSDDRVIILDHAHLGGTVEIIPALSNDEWTAITTCDGIAYMKAEDLQAEPFKRWRSLGVKRITHYCPCTRCGTGNGVTASGRTAQVGRTIAVHKSVAPLGAHILINDREYIVDDRGVGPGTVDIFVSSHKEAKQLGTYKAEIFILEE